MIAKVWSAAANVVATASVVSLVVLFYLLWDGFGPNPPSLATFPGEPWPVVGGYHVTDAAAVNAIHALLVMVLCLPFALILLMLNGSFRRLRLPCAVIVLAVFVGAIVIGNSGARPDPQFLTPPTDAATASP